MFSYYNEIDPYAAQWIRNLIRDKAIPDGEVDERDIKDVAPQDLKGFKQCHFFSGIAVWAYALRLAGWPDDREVWTGSCPCQPFSTAGRKAGFTDERHLWPHWHYLIRECQPTEIFGEQVASKDGLSWFDLVSTDLENTNYAVGAADLCAAGFGSPNIRQRLFFAAERLADSNDKRLQGSQRGRPPAQEGQPSRYSPERGSAFSYERMVHSQEVGLEQKPRDRPRSLQYETSESKKFEFRVSGTSPRTDGEGPRETNGFWRDADWLLCQDGFWRPVEPGTFPLVNGAPGKMGRLCAYGNGLNAAVTEGFIRAYMAAPSARLGGSVAQYENLDVSDVLGVPHSRRRGYSNHEPPKPRRT